MASDEPSEEMQFGTSGDLSYSSVLHQDRHVGVRRYVAATLVGFLVGILNVSSIQVGVAWGFEGLNPTNWNLLLWGDHWVWRAIASAVATTTAGFLAGMVARHRGTGVAIACMAPSAAYWAFVAWAGWAGHAPLPGFGEVYLPLGFRIVATILALVTLPLAGAAGREGAAYGRANAEHFDARRGTLLGVRWYHFIWLPLLIHPMIVTATFGAVYGFQWFALALRNGFSFLVLIPTFFYVAMLLTLQLLGTGAFRTYEALAGFTDDTGTPVWRRVLKFGFGYTALTVLAQAAVTLVHYGLAASLRKLLG